MAIRRECRGIFISFPGIVASEGRINIVLSCRKRFHHDTCPPTFFVSGIFAAPSGCGQTHILALPPSGCGQPILALPPSGCGQTHILALPPSGCCACFPQTSLRPQSMPPLCKGRCLGTRRRGCPFPRHSERSEDSLCFPQTLPPSDEGGDKNL